MNPTATTVVDGGAERHRIPVTVVGGYLGAGKTTLVNHLLSMVHGERIAVLVNDFGAINLDVALVRSRDADTIELTNGCICCSLAEGFAQAMQRIDARSPRVDRLVIETSGVADPGAVAQYGHLPGFRLAAVIVLADAETIRSRSTDRYVGRQVLEQLKSADVIVLNKVDLVDDPTLTSLHAFMADIAPHVPVVTTERSLVPNAMLFESSVDMEPTGRANAHRLGHDDTDDPHRSAHRSAHRSGHRSWTMVGDLAVDRNTLTARITALPPSIVRGKGIVSFGTDPALWVLQKVGARTTCTREPSLDATFDERGSQLVFIGLPSFDHDATITALASDLGLRLMPSEGDR